MNTLTLFYSSQYFDIEPQYDRSGTKRYFLDITIKPKWIYEEISKIDLPVLFKEPQPLTEDDILLAHNQTYLDAVKNGDPRDLASSSGILWSRKLFRSQLFVNAGMYEAGKDALKNQISGTLSGGFHHASKDRGGGFCVFNGLAVAVRKLQSEGLVSKALVFDCDVHYGNGTADIFADDERVFTVSIFKYNLEGTQETSTQKTATAVAAAVTNADEYLAEVKKLPSYLEKHRPDVILFNAGMDPFEEDRYGGIKGVTKDVLCERDKFVFDTCKKFKVPAAFALEGGYVRYRGEQGDLISEEEIKKRKSALVDLYTSLVETASDVVSGG